jgi:hypothetical protein
MRSGKVYVIDKATGTVTSLYSDDSPLNRLGPQTVSRASNVEPAASGQGWDVILTDNPINGKFAGHVVARNVPRRDLAIKLEVDFINEHILGVPAHANN